MGGVTSGLRRPQPIPLGVGGELIGSRDRGGDVIEVKVGRRPGRQRLYARARVLVGDLPKGAVGVGDAGAGRAFGAAALGKATVSGGESASE